MDFAVDMGVVWCLVVWCLVVWCIAWLSALDLSLSADKGRKGPKRRWYRASYIPHSDFRFPHLSGSPLLALRFLPLDPYDAVADFGHLAV
jgi:hypothetical protein